MKVIINDGRTQGMDLTYTENLWTGQRTITYNNVAAKKQSRKQFLLQMKNGAVPFEVRGNLFAGVTLISPILTAPVQVRRAFSPLEYVLAILAAVLGIACGILGGYVGGVIGGVLQGCLYGLIGGLGFALVGIAVLGIGKRWLRYLVCVELVLVCAALAFFTGYGLALWRISMI